MFFGPIETNNSEEAEIEAHLHLIRLILIKKIKMVKICISSDSTSTIASICKGL